jgi:hypothetical protein
VVIGNETVELIAPVEHDAHGDPVPGTGAERVVDGAVVYPRTSSESADRSGTVEGQYVALLPILETEVAETMKLRWRGRVYDIDGDAMPWVFLSSGYAGCQVNLKYGRN